MDCRRALLILLAILTLDDLAGVMMLREAWSARHDESAHRERAAARVSPANAPPGSDLLAVHTGR